MDLTLFIPLALKLLGFFLDRSKAKQEVKDAYKSLIIASQKDGLISVQTGDDFKDEVERLKNGPDTKPKS